MSTADPTGDGGGGPASTTPTGDTVTPVTSSTGIAVSPGSHHHQQHPPPSPLSGCYLLVVLPEPHTAQHRDLILNQLAKGFLSWDKDSCHVDLEKELHALVAQAPEGEEARNGERLIQYATENLVTEVLIHPQTNTLQQCIRNLLASFTKHRHIIHAGYTFSGNGSWILQDGTFSLADFLDAFSEHDVQRVLRAYENSVTVDINCAGVGEWSTTRLSKEACTRSCRVRLNPDDVLTAGVPAITSFTNYVGQYLVSQTLDQLMEPSDVVGNIRFSHPTLYVFPGGQGDAALFGINGFNMLVDGGFARKACFWDFARHLDRLDAVLMTRINNSNVGGMCSVLRKKREMHVYPQIGHFFCNLIERRHLNSPDGDKDLDPLILNLTDIGHEMMVDLRHINLRAHPCYRDPNPINLYHKVGHGTLDMYVLNPTKDSREVREFLTKWHASDSKLFGGSYRKDSNNLTFPIQNLASICALLVWQPANPEDTITRILFPGSTPQHKIFEGIERLKHLEFLKHPVCTAKSLSPSTSLMTLKDRPSIKQKMSLIEEPKKASDAKKEKREILDAKLSKATEEIGSKVTSQPTPISHTPKTVQPAKIDVKTKKVMENKKIETEGKKTEKDLKESKKESVKKDIPKIEKDIETKKLEGYKIKVDNEKAVLAKETKAKPEPKKKEPKESKPVRIAKIETPSKPAVKIADKKQKSAADKKDSVKPSPSTPKKMMNGGTTKVELSRATSRPITKPSSKQLPSTMPAKSAKDANNRKVVEQKNIENATAASAAAPAAAKVLAKQKTAERKPIGRRPKPVSPIKARIPISPTKSTRSTPTTSVKSDKDGIIRRVKGDRGTTDSSTVSTPSGIEIDSMNKLADKCLTEKSEDMSLDSIESRVLADLKEEREVVEEIEAVLQKAERIEGTRREDHLEGDDDITAEATDKKEEDMTEDDVTADIEELPKKESSRKTSHELTEEDEYLIIEKEEIYIEDSVQSAEGEDKHVVSIAESEKEKTRKDADKGKEDEEKEEDEEEEDEDGAEVSEEKEKTDIPEKQLNLKDEDMKEMKSDEILLSPTEVLKEEQMQNIIASAAETVQKTEEKDDSGKKDSEDITKEPSSLSPDKFDSSEKKTTDTDIKPEIDQKDQQIPEKLEESHERISTLESGATTTAPTLPEDERITLDEIKEVVDEKCIVDLEKKADSTIQVQEPSVAQVPAEPKSDAKAFEVHPPPHTMQREIVKTPDEVADLPVHEEVDPKLYHMEHFEKAKDEKPIQPAAIQQREVKEPEVPPVKEQKGVFSFFGKVADKFEKGIDKLTGKSRRDSEKDIDEKSSSKSGSPKEIKAQSIIFPGDAEPEEPSAAVAKVTQAHGIMEKFEKGEPIISEIKVAAIKDTATFLKEEIDDLKKTSQPVGESNETEDKIHTTQEQTTKTDIGVERIAEPIFEKCVMPDGKNKLDGISSELEAEEDVEDVQALLEEASKKFKTVKDSLHDSLESLEEKIAEQEMVRVELEAASKDFVKDTLNEVVEKLEDMKPQEDEESTDRKELETVIVPQTEDSGDEKGEALSTITKDLKEAVRDVGEVLAGSAGILIEEKPKDVVEIVKKVAEVLKKDDFLSHDVLFDTEAPKVEDKEDADGDKLKKPSIETVMMPKKVGITEELPPQEEIEEIPESRGDSAPSLIKLESSGELDIHKDHDVTMPCEKDAAIDRAEAMEICADLMKTGPILSSPEKSDVEDSAKPDVLEAGVESICIKHKVEHPMTADDKIEESSVTFDRKVSPVTAEVVMVTPDMSPTSPKLPSDKMHKEGTEAAEVSDVTHLLPTDVLNALSKDKPLEEVIEELTITRSIKITLEIIEYIIITRKVPREKVIWVIEEIILKKGVPTENVVADLDLLRLDTISTEKRQDVERFINDEYIINNKNITMKVIHDICIKKLITRHTLMKIITEYLGKNNIPLDTVLDIPEKELSQFGLSGESMPEEELASETPGSPSTKDDEKQEIISPEVSNYSDVKKFIMDELIAKGQRITPQLIDDVCVAKLIPRRGFVDIIEQIIIEQNIPRSTIFDISEKELSELLASEKENEAISGTEVIKDYGDEASTITPEKRQEIVTYIFNEFITKKNKITSHTFRDICVRYKISEQILLKLIEATVDEGRVSRASILDISDNELTELLSIDGEEDAKESTLIECDVQGVRVDDSKEKSTILDRSEIENAIVEDFVLKKRRITPYIFEDICIRYKVPRRIILEIIEEIIVKKNVQRNAILDITDTELTELLAVVEAQGEDDSVINVESAVEESSIQDGFEEDKLVDGFVNIPSKESEKDLDDFEAVEQEYKIHDVPVTSDKMEPRPDLSENEIADVMRDTIADKVRDVIEAEKKISESLVSSVLITTGQKSEDTSERSEIVDTTEKYLIEAQEKAEMKSSSPVQPLDVSSDDKKLSELSPDKGAKMPSPQRETKLVDTAETPGEITSTVATTKLGTVDAVEEEIQPKEVESTRKSSVTEDSDDITKLLDDVSMMKDQDGIEQKIEPISLKSEKSSKDIITTEESLLSTGTVHRMVVTATSEDGGQETEVCSAQSIVFTPEDSLKSSPIKTTPDQDSLRVDKEGLHSGVSTPERDSISEKSITGPKDGDKITPEDSLDKSPSGTRDSQDLEDSLDKSDLSKLKETDSPKPPVEEQDEKTSRKSSKTMETVDEQITGVIKSLESVEDADLKMPAATPSKCMPSVDKTGETTIKQVDSISVTGESHTEASPAKSITDGVKVVEKSTADSEMPETVAQELSEKEHLAEQLKPSRDLRDSEIQIGQPILSPTIVGDKDNEQSHVPIPSDKIEQQLDLQLSSPTSKESSIVDEQLTGDSTRSSDSGLITTKETRAGIVVDQVALSKVSEHKQVEKTDIHEKSSSIASKVPSPIERDALLEKPDHASIVATKDIDEPISQRSQSPSDEHDVEDKHDRLKRSSVFHDSASGSGYDFKPISPSGEVYPDRKVEPLSSPSFDSQRTKSLSSCVTKSIDGVQLETAEIISSRQQHEDEGSDKKDLSHRDISPSTGDKESERSAGSITSASPEQEVIPDVSVQDEKSSTLLSTSISSEGHPQVDEEEKIATELTDKSKSVIVIGGKQDDDKFIERSSPVSAASGKSDIHSDKHGDQVVDEVHHQPEVPSPTIELDVPSSKKPIDTCTLSSPDKIQSIDATTEDPCKTSSIDGDKYSKEDNSRVGEEDILLPRKSPEESVDTSRSHSVAGDEGEVAIVARSKSPSIASSIASDVKVLDIRGRSKSPGVGDADTIEGELLTLPSDKHDKIVSAESVVTAETPKSPTAERQEASKSRDTSRSPSVIDEKHDDEKPIDRSRAPSVAVEIQDEKEPISGPKLSSVTSVKLEQKGTIDPSKSVVHKIQDKSEPVDQLDVSSIITEKRHEMVSTDRSKSPSIATEKDDEEGSIDRSRTSSITSEKQSDKEATSVSRSPSIAADAHGEDRSVSRSRSSSIATTKQDEKETIDGSVSLSIIADERKTQKQVDEPKQESIDRSRSSSTATGKHEEKESIDRSRSPSVISGTHDDKQSIDRSRSPSIIGEKEDETKLIERSESLSSVTGKPSEKESIDRSRSPSIADDKQDKKEQKDRSQPPSIVSEQLDEKLSIDRSRSPSIVGDKQEDTNLTDRSGSLSPLTEKQDEKQPIDRSRSSSIARDKHDEVEQFGRSKPSSIVSEDRDEKISIDRSRSPSIVGDEQEETKLTDRSGSLSPVTAKQDDKQSIDRSRTPSIAGDKQHEKEQLDRSKPSSSVSEDRDEKISIDRSRSPSIIGDKQEETKLTDRSGSLSPVTAKQDEKESMDRSRSSSIAADKQHDKEQLDRSKPSSIVSEDRDEKISIDRSRSPSIVGDKEETKLTDRSESLSPVTAKQDERQSIDRSRSPSIAGDKQHEKEQLDRSKPSSIVSEDRDEKISIGRSRSPSIIGDKQEETKLTDRSGSLSPVTAKQDERESIDRSRTPSIAGDKQHEKEQLDRSKPSSIVSEDRDEKISIDRSRSPSIIGDKQEETKLTDRSGSLSPVTAKQDEKESTDRSRSSSIASDKQHDKEQLDRSKPSSIVSEDRDEKISIDRSRSPSIVGHKEETKLTDRSESLSPVTAKQDEKQSIDRSRSPSIAGDKQHEKEQLDRSKPSSIVSEDRDEKISIGRSRSPSIIGDKQEETKLTDRSGSLSPVTAKQDEKESIDRSRSSSIAADKQHDKEQLDRSKPSSIVSEDRDEKISIDRSRSHSIVGDNQEETKLTDRSGSLSPVTGKQDDKQSIDRSRTPSIVGDKQHEKEQLDRSKPSSVVSEDRDEKISIDRSRSPSIVGDKEETKLTDRAVSLSPVTAKQDEKQSIDRSRSPSIAGDKQHDKEQLDRSKPSSIVSEDRDKKISIDRSRSPSIVGDKEGTKLTDRSESLSPVTAKQDEKESIDRSRSSSIASDKRHDKEKLDRSKPSSIASEDQDEKISIDRSRSPSIVGDKEDTKLTDRSGSLSLVTAKQVEKQSIDGSRSPSIAGDKQHEKEQLDRSKPSSIVSEDRDEKISIDRSRSPSIVGDKQMETKLTDRSGSLSPVTAKQDEKESIDRSRSSSIAADKQHDKEQLDRSKPSSIVSEDRDEKISIDRSRSPSIVGDKEDTILTDRSGSLSPVTAKQDEKQPIDGSRSPSIAGDKQHEKEQLDRSKPSSIVSEDRDEKISIDRSRSPSIVGDKQMETKLTDRSGSLSPVTAKQDEKESIDRSRSSSIAADKQHDKEQLDRSKPSSIVSEDRDEKISIDRSRSPSIVGDQQEETKLIERSESLSSVAGKQTEKQSIDGSRSPSIAGDKEDEKEQKNRSEPPSIVSEEPDEKISVDRSRSPSIVGHEHEEAKLTDRSGSLSPVTGKQEEKQSIDGSRSPSIAGGKQDEAEQIDRSKPPSIVSEERDEKISIDRSRSPSIVGDKHEETKLTDRSGSLSPMTGKQSDRESIDCSGSPSIAGDKRDGKEQSDRSKPSSIVSEEPDGRVSTDRSRSPSIVGDKQDEQKLTDRSGSLSPVTGKPAEKESIDRSRSPSVVADKHDETEEIDRSKPSSIVSEEQGDKASIDRSRSPSIVDVKRDEMKLMERAASLSPATAKQIDRESIDRSRSSSIVSEEHEKLSIDGSRSPSIVGDKHGESKVIEHFSIVTGKPSKKGSIDGSRSPSIAAEKLDEKDFAERSRSASTVSDIDGVITSADLRKSSTTDAKGREEKDSIDRSRSPSIAVETRDEKKSTDHPVSPSSTLEMKDTKESSDHSKSPSISDDKDDGPKSIGHAYLPTTTIEKQHVIGTSFSTTAEQMAHTEPSDTAAEMLDRKLSSDHTTSSSIDEEKSRKESVVIVAEKHDEIDSKDRSGSQSITPEIPDVTELMKRSRSSSIPDKQEKTVTTDICGSPSTGADHVEDKRPVDHASSLSDVTDTKEDGKQIETSRPTTIPLDKHKDTDVIDVTSIKVEADDEKSPKFCSGPAKIDDVKSNDTKPVHTEKSPTIDPKEGDGKKPVEVYPLSSIVFTTGDASQDMQVDKQPIDDSSSSPITSERHDEDKQMMDHAKSPSTDGITEEEKVSVDHLKASSITAEKDETRHSTDQSKSSDITPGKEDIMEFQSRSRISSLAPENETEVPIDSSKISITNEPDVEELIGHSSSLQGDKEPTDRSRTPSISKEKQDKEESVDRVKSPNSQILDSAKPLREMQDSVAIQKVDELTDGGLGEEIGKDGKSDKDATSTGSNLSSAITQEKQEQKSIEPSLSSPITDRKLSDVDKSKNISITDAHSMDEKSSNIRQDSVAGIITGQDSRLDGSDAVQALQKLAETIADRSDESKCDTKSHAGETVQHDSSRDRSRSHSLFEADERTPLGRSRTASLFDDKVPELCSTLVGEVSSHQEPEQYSQDKSPQGMIKEENMLEKSSVTEIVNEKIDSSPSDSRKHSIAQIDVSLTKRSSVGTTADRPSSQFESITSHGSTTLADGRIAKVGLSHDMATETGLSISDIKRTEVQNYIMEECVKKGIRINVLVLEQIITKMRISRSVLLYLIENIIVTRKLSRTVMVDNAVNDEIETTKLLECRFSEEMIKPGMESSSGKQRAVFGDSSPDPKFSGHSTHESRQYDDEFGKGMPAYSNDYESPFHKAFVGGMTEMRTTHITTLSGKSTPEYSVRDETSELLSDSSSQVKSTDTRSQASVIDTTDMAMTTVPTTSSTTIDTTTSLAETKISKDNLSREVFSEYHDPSVTKDIDTSDGDKIDATSEITKMTSRERLEEAEPEVNIITRTRTIVAEEKEPTIARKIIREEAEEEEPQIIVTVKQRFITDQEDEATDDSEARKITLVREESQPEITKTITTKRIETIVTDDVSHHDDKKIQATSEQIISKLRSTDTTQDVQSIKELSGVDVKTIITTVTTSTEPEEQVSAHKTLSIDSQQTDKHKRDSIETTEITTSGLHKIVDSDKSFTDMTCHDDTSKSLIKAEKIVHEKSELPMSPVIKDLISDQRSYSGRASPDMPSTKEAQHGIQAGKSTTDSPSSPFFRDSAGGHSAVSGRSTPDKRPTSRSSTATPESLRSNEIIRTTITTTRTMSEEGDIITTTMEITETTNDKGETIILAEKTDVKVEDRILPSSIDKSAFISGVEGMRVPTDLSSETDVDPISPRSDHSSLHSRAGTHVWEGSEDRHTYSDDDVPGSPLSTTSQVGYSPQSTYHFGDHSFDKGSSHKSMEFSEADMSSSFYGELPDLPPRVTTMKAAFAESSAAAATGSASTDDDFSFKKLTAERELTGTSTDKKSSGKRYIDDADLDFEKTLTEREGMERELTSAIDTCDLNGRSSSSQPHSEGHKDKDSEKKKDPLAGWDSPLGLPSPKPPRKFNLRTATRANDSTEVSPNSINFDPINDWGEPLRLPSPSVVADDASNKGAPSTPKKERKQPKKVISENIKNRKRSESPAKNEKKSKDTKSKVQPVYMDLTYVPHHGNSYYTSVEFFKRVRARYYVFSGTEPSREVYDALLDAKKTWEDKDLEVTMIPTYDTDTLGYWVADNEEALAANHIDLSPSASRCTINLQDHETSCSAYRLEF